MRSLDEKERGTSKTPRAYLSVIYAICLHNSANALFGKLGIFFTEKALQNIAALADGITGMMRVKPINIAFDKFDQLYRIAVQLGFRDTVPFVVFGCVNIQHYNVDQR